MRTILKFKINKIISCLTVAILIFAIVEPLQAQETTIRDHKNQISYIPLDHFWSSSRTDNYSTANAKGKSGALNTNYRFVRTDGYILNEASNVEGQAVPLYLYYSDARKDNFTTSTVEGIRAAEASGYRKVRMKGHVLRTVSPEYQHLYKPLWLYYHDIRKDNFTIATSEGMRAAELGGYRKVRIEGYIRVKNPSDRSFLKARILLPTDLFPIPIKNKELRKKN